MPQFDQQCRVSSPTQLTSERMSTQDLPERHLLSMNVIRAAIAVFIAFVGLSLVLQKASAEPRLHQAYLPVVTADAGLTKQTHSGTPDAVISVVARAGVSCKAGETLPVTGARITVVTDHGSRIGLTNESGYAVFSAASEPAVIQIEWPAGLFPCPHSRPMAELPNGAGEVTFVAVTARSP